MGLRICFLISNARDWSLSSAVRVLISLRLFHAIQLCSALPQLLCPWWICAPAPDLRPSQIGELLFLPTLEPCMSRETRTCLVRLATCRLLELRESHIYVLHFIRLTYELAVKSGEPSKMRRRKGHGRMFHFLAHRESIIRS